MGDNAGVTIMQPHVELVASFVAENVADAVWAIPVMMTKISLTFQAASDHFFISTSGDASSVSF